MDINDFNKVIYKKNDEDDEKSIINLNLNENIDSDDLNYNFSTNENGLNSNFYPSVEFKAPPKRSELSSFINSPISKTLDTFSKLSKISLNKEEDRPTYDIFDKKNEVKPNQKFPPPALPEIEVTSIIKKRSNLPLTLDDYNNKFKLKSKKFLFDKIFTSGIETNELRRQLWPILLGLMNNDDEKNWEPLENLYELYSNQWKSINLDQESRFTAFREKKSMAERDVIRCDRRHPYFESEENLELLKDLLMSYVMYDFDTGYVQGMTDLAAPLLYIFEGNLVKSFWCFTRVLKLTKKNFEMTQLTVKNLLIKLFKLINLTDPCFAQYLSENESDNCYFAFRWLICLFKREFVKEDDYEQLLVVWDTLWAIDAYEKVRKEEADVQYKKQEDLIKNSHLINKLINETNNLNIDEKEESQTENLNEENIKNENDPPLTSFQLFFLALSLAIIRQERDFIFSQKLDASEIIKHFNTLKLNDCLNSLLNQATKIWCWLKYDGGEDQLYLEPMSNNNFDLLDD